MGKAKLYLIAVFALFVFNLHAQDGVSEVRFTITEAPICEDPYGVFVDIEVKAAEGSSFFMSEQNYRFSFNRDALANPSIAEELLTGFIPGGSGPLGFTLYSPHNLTGSLDTVVSYNVELQGGDGVLATDDRWIPVGRMNFDVLDESACFNLEFHSQSRFPPTFVGEVYIENDVAIRVITNESNYGDLARCIVDICQLPVELISFTGEERDCTTHLNWQTATETNSDFFVVERSANGINYTEIGRLNAAGNSQTLVNYDFIDTNPNVQNYYRLKQVDLDGTYEYTEVIRINTTCFDGTMSDILDIYPNPVSSAGQINMNVFSKTNQSANINILNVEGKTLLTKQINMIEGINALHYSVAELAAGTYFIRLEGDDWHSNAQKFIKVND